jgi:hypothetical protein
MSDAVLHETEAAAREWAQQLRSELGAGWDATVEQVETARGVRFEAVARRVATVRYTKLGARAELGGIVGTGPSARDAALVMAANVAADRMGVAGSLLLPGECAGVPL